MKKLLSKTQIFIVLLATASQPVYGLLENGFNTTRPSWFFDGVIPAEITPQLPKACVESYTASIACNKTILMSPNVLEKPDTLETVCESSCAESMLKFEKNVKRDCSDVDLVGLGLEDSWMSLILMGKAGILLYWKQCVRDKYVLLNIKEDPLNIREC